MGTVISMASRTLLVSKQPIRTVSLTKLSQNQVHATQMLASKQGIVMRSGLKLARDNRTSRCNLRMPFHLLPTTSQHEEAIRAVNKKPERAKRNAQELAMCKL